MGKYRGRSPWRPAPQLQSPGHHARIRNLEQERYRVRVRKLAAIREEAAPGLPFPKGYPRSDIFDPSPCETHAYFGDSPPNINDWIKKTIPIAPARRLPSQKARRRIKTAIAPIAIAIWNIVTLAAN